MNGSEYAEPIGSAFLCLDGWAGRTEQAVEIVADVGRMVRIRAITDGTKLAGARRYINRAETALVPAYAIRRSNNPDQTRVLPSHEAGCSASLVAQNPRDVSELYHELLHAVARKFPGESRHETALRYIRDTESALVNPDQIIGDRDMSNESKPEPEVR